jgi:hypothetical protein
MLHRNYTGIGAVGFTGTAITAAADRFGAASGELC